jgi:hypothetical protein
VFASVKRPPETASVADCLTKKLVDKAPRRRMDKAARLPVRQEDDAGLGGMESERLQHGDRDSRRHLRRSLPVRRKATGMRQQLPQRHGGLAAAKPRAICGRPCETQFGLPLEIARRSTIA